MGKQNCIAENSEAFSFLYIYILLTIYLSIYQYWQFFIIYVLSNEEIISNFPGNSLHDVQANDKKEVYISWGRAV